MNETSSQCPCFDISIAIIVGSLICHCLVIFMFAHIYFNLDIYIFNYLCFEWFVCWLIDGLTH